MEFASLLRFISSQLFFPKKQSMKGVEFHLQKLTEMIETMLINQSDHIDRFTFDLSFIKFALQALSLAKMMIDSYEIDNHIQVLFAGLINKLKESKGRQPEAEDDDTAFRKHENEELMRIIEEKKPISDRIEGSGLSWYLKKMEKKEQQSLNFIQSLGLMTNLAERKQNNKNSTQSKSTQTKQTKQASTICSRTHYFTVTLAKDPAENKTQLNAGDQQINSATDHKKKPKVHCGSRVRTIDNQHFEDEFAKNQVGCSSRTMSKIGSQSKINERSNKWANVQIQTNKLVCSICNSNLQKSDAFPLKDPKPEQSLITTDQKIAKTGLVSNVFQWRSNSSENGPSFTLASNQFQCRQNSSQNGPKFSYSQTVNRQKRMIMTVHKDQPQKIKFDPSQESVVENRSSTLRNCQVRHIDCQISNIEKSADQQGINFNPQKAFENIQPSNKQYDELQKCNPLQGRENHPIYQSNQETFRSRFGKNREKDTGEKVFKYHNEQTEQKNNKENRQANLPKQEKLAPKTRIDHSKQLLPSIHKQIPIRKKQIKISLGSSSHFDSRLANSKQEYGIDSTGSGSRFKASKYEPGQKKMGLSITDSVTQKNVKLTQQQLCVQDNKILESINELRYNGTNAQANKQVRYYIQLFERMHRKTCGGYCKHLERLEKVLENYRDARRIPMRMAVGKIDF